ncbi:hypothetical protein KAI19_02960 [bacterium]|nr:hypothetical protein [bacterium]
MCTIVILFITGIAFIFIEIFVPGGIFGLSGALAIFGSIFLCFRDYPSAAFYVLFLELVFAGIAIVLALKFLPKTKFGKYVILSKKEDKNEGFVSHDSLRDIEGKQGVALTLLRPAGKVNINGKKFDVVTEGGYVQKNEKVKVVTVSGKKIVVRKTNNQ